MIEGRVWKYGDHVNTDLIIPGRYLDDYDLRSLAAHVMEDLDPSFSKKVRHGDVVVAGRNFGCGSSREQAPVALKHAGVSAVVAGSFARIFYRNAINVGLPVIVCPEAASRLVDGDIVVIDVEEGVLVRPSSHTRIEFKPLPGFLLEILSDGGLVPHMKKRCLK
ncbi:MAG: 3-isopropylmalate dehydratase small subunit [Methanomassiliicoccales archaeon]|nr:3-isopropylmalate dehydratase small subunit [Methanomassiliicoccales archaeon]